MDKMPKGLKIKNRTGYVFWYSSWTAGVEYDENDYEENEKDLDEQNKNNYE